eukprot:CAMPEP_0175067254 /NCGR_PEP_ID=MMETSP0052_2-20121109/16988_1 /TAXON_ID=51329 ORGANISM="Polytomella parva, Strain SAG 63-3" /NCGR_SAMPLE_ID=MMETSP0052_2 /ASSEMBLY_ACC=CAM_ASM_000194 /LENGTH=80 /DNA_ID=CAMNT_0016334099 /DNA_START=107 /DNA_END=345 /DNA_ORIENTATION=-
MMGVDDGYQGSGAAVHGERSRANARLPGQVMNDDEEVAEAAGDMGDSPRVNNTKLDRIRLWVQSNGTFYFNTPETGMNGG